MIVMPTLWRYIVKVLVYYGGMNELTQQAPCSVQMKYLLKAVYVKNSNLHVGRENRMFSAEASHIASLLNAREATCAAR